MSGNRRDCFVPVALDASIGDACLMWHGVANAVSLERRLQARWWEAVAGKNGLCAVSFPAALA